MTKQLVYDERTGEMVEVEDDFKPALWNKKPLSIAAKHRNASTWNAKEARENGSVGGSVAASRMTPQQLKERAQKAAQSRWGK